MLSYLGLVFQTMDSAIHRIYNNYSPKWMEVAIGYCNQISKL